MKRHIVVALFCVVLAFTACSSAQSSTLSDTVTDTIAEGASDVITKTADKVSEKSKASEEAETSEEDETTEVASTEEDAEDASTDETEETSSGIRPEFKETMDGYEDFFNTYCEFIESYDSSDLASAAKYAELMTQYSETMESLNDWSSKDMSDEEYVYYTEVMGRINTRLAKVSVNN